MLRDLQNFLSRFYEIEHALDVYDYLVTDASVLTRWEHPDEMRSTQEKLLIRESDDELAMLLFLDADLLERLMERDPRQHLGRSNLADFWTVLEGVSHFNYVAWNASADKSVTLMELEMQAEVDKYVCARALLQRQSKSDLARSLIDHLFDDAGFDPHLAPHELERYQDASTYAGRYCQSLEKRFASPHLAVEMVRELRCFYRLPQPEKLSHIQTAFFA